MPGYLLQEQFKTGKMSPVELLEAQIRRAESVNLKINAYTDTYYDEAMDQARLAEKLFARKNGPVRPLEGLTLAIKDNQALAGKRTTHASLVYKEEIETENSPTSQRLLDAGVISEEEAESHPNANVITRAVGGAAQLVVDVAMLDVAPGDRFLLCSDGLYNELDRTALARGLQQPDVETAAQSLLQAALQAGARDNVSVIVVEATDEA